MDVAQEYRLSHRGSKARLALTHRVGFVPAGLILVLFYAYGAKSGPGLWMGLGVALALQLALWSARSLPRYPEGRTRLGSRFSASIDGWLPPFVILIQAGFLGVTTAVLWFTLIELGFDSSLSQHICIALWVVLQPIRRIAHLRSVEHSHKSDEVVYHLAHYLSHITLTFFIAVTCNNLMIPTQAAPGNSPVAPLLVWIPAILAIISFAVLFVDHVLRKLPPRSSSSQPTDSLG